MGDFSPFDQLILPTQRGTGPFDTKVVLDPGTPGDPMDRLTRMMDELSRPETLSLKPWVAAGRTPVVEPAIIRTGRNSYLLRGDSEHEVELVRIDVESGKFRTFTSTAPLTHAKTENPTITSNFSLPLGAIARALAKMAMNFLALAWGVDVARQARFEPVKTAVRTGVGILNFAHMFEGEDTDRFGAIPGHHCIILVSAPGVVGARIWLFQKLIARVRLAGEAQPTDNHRAGLFDYKTRQYRIVTTAELAEELLALGVVSPGA